MKVSVFIPCYIDQLEPQVGLKMIQLLEFCGHQVRVPQKTMCCGQPACNAGFQDDGKKVATQFLEDFKNDQYIIIPSASCSGFVKNYIPNLLPQNENLFITKQIFEIADFLIHHCKINFSQFSFPYKVAYHTSCAALREYKTTENTFQLLKQIPDLELVDFEYAETCCGFGGTFAEKFSDISISMAKHKLEMLHKKKFDYVVSNDSSCLIHLRSVAKKINSPIKFIHFVEALI